MKDSTATEEGFTIALIYGVIQKGLENAARLVSNILQKLGRIKLAEIKNVATVTAFLDTVLEFSLGKKQKLAKTAPTLHAVLGAYYSILCNVPHQDFEAASVIRDLQREIDPLNSKRLTEDQVTAVVAFLDLVYATHNPHARPVNFKLPT